MSDSPPKSWLPLVLIVGGLVVWGGLLALGAFLNWGADQPHHDLRKAAIVVGTMTGFLALWGMALLVRSRRRP
jgi:hypothetical protein